MKQIKNNEEFIDALTVNLNEKIALLKSFDEERDRLNGLRINNIDTELYKIDESSILSGIEKSEALTLAGYKKEPSAENIKKALKLLDIIYVNQNESVKLAFDKVAMNTKSSGR